MPSLTKTELEQDVLLLGFRAHRPPQERISAPIWPDVLAEVLKLALIVEVIWAAHKVGDLICIILEIN